MSRFCFRSSPIGAIFRGAVLALYLAQPREMHAGETAVSRDPLASAQQRASSSGPTERIRHLREEIARHDTLYFVKAAPEISDAHYDELKRELSRLEQTHPEAVRSAAPLREIGDDRSPGFTRYQHAEPMLSLAKSYTEAELRAFVARVRKRFEKPEPRFIIEPKFDGVAISVTYEQGKLIRAVTRGDGRVGDDVTANVLAIRNLPHRLRAISARGAINPLPDLIELRGEILISNAEFQRINREQEATGEPPYAHPRNLAAGTLKQHDAHAIAARGLEVVFHGWGAVVPAQALPGTHSEFHELVRAWGLPAVQGVKRMGYADVWTAIKAVGENRAGLEFPIDGAVVKLNTVAQQRELGASDSAPHWAMAYKFAPERVETTLRGITFQVGRTGVLTPVAEFMPVRLAGSTITRASLYNGDEIMRQDLRIGDTVILEKAGEIIPAIVGVDLTRRTATSAPFVFPAACPKCGAQIGTAEGGGYQLRCPNRECAAQVQRRLEHFASKGAMNIPGLGPATIETLVTKGWVKEIPDLYRLERGQLMTLGRSVSPSTDRLLASIEASKRADLWRVIHGLGIPRVGPSSAEALARHFGTLCALANALPDSLEKERSTLKALIGEASTDAMIAHLSAPKNRAMIEQLVSLGVDPAH
ncbi:MAG: NAD-dependent DNA ligase LigA [Opitutaceae bacterium]